VVLKAGYQLLPVSDKSKKMQRKCSFTDLELTHFAQLLEGEGDDETAGAATLTMTDEYYGEPGKSSIKYESDLAPYKPRCDVVLKGHSYAPKGKPTKDWIARARLIARPAGSKEEEREPQVAMDKSLKIMGSRKFERSIIGWSICAPEPTDKKPLLWEYAFGGASATRNPDADKQFEKPYLINEVCYTNPLGGGWVDQQWFEILKKADIDLPKELSAPSILYPRDEFETLIQTKNPPIDVPQGYEYRVMTQAAKDYPIQPAGFSWVGRSWIPRLSHAGTYDHHWQEKRWPNLPEDFDFSYWNGAPRDQQIPFPESNFTLELLNLTPARHPEGGLAITGGTYAVVQMPSHRAGLIIRTRDGLMLPMAMTIDTIVFDTDQMQVNVSWRAAVLKSVDVRVIETRFEQDPAAHLIRIQDPQDQSIEVSYG
jgi:hypothetical protein